MEIDYTEKPIFYISTEDTIIQFSEQASKDFMELLLVNMDKMVDIKHTSCYDMFIK